MDEESNDGAMDYHSYTDDGGHINNDEIVALVAHHNDVDGDNTSNAPSIDTNNSSIATTPTGNVPAFAAFANSNGDSIMHDEGGHLKRRAKEISRPSLKPPPPSTNLATLTTTVTAASNNEYNILLPGRDTWAGGPNHGELSFASNHVDDNSNNRDDSFETARDKSFECTNDASAFSSLQSLDDNDDDDEDYIEEEEDQKVGPVKNRDDVYGPYFDEDDDDL